MKRALFRVSMAVITLAGISFSCYQLAKRIKIHAVLASDRGPYTVWLHDFTYRTKIGNVLDFSTPHDGQTYLTARKADGSVAEITFASYTAPGDYSVALRKLTIMPKTTLPLREDEVAVIKALPNDRNCVAHPEWVGPHEFNGVGRYAGLSVAKHTIRSATAITELWEAPDLDCTIVYQKTLFLDAKGEPSDANVRSAFAIQRQEPESWIFAANAGKQVPPAAVGRF